MPSVQQKGQRWYAVLKPDRETGRREWVGLDVKSKRAALSEACRLEQERGRLKNSKPLTRWRETAAIILREIKKTKTKNWYSPTRCMVGRFEKFAGNRPALDITPEICRAFVTERLAEKASPSTVRKEARLLKSIFSRCVEAGACQSNPWQGIKLPPEPKHPPKFLTMDEFSKLLDAAKDREEWFRWVLLVETGARPSEAKRLVWADVDFAGQQLTLKNSQKGSGTRLAARSVPIPRRLLGALRERKGAASAPVLSRMHNWRREIVESVKRAEIRHVAPYDLRHTYAAWLAQSGMVTLLKIRDLMGHESIVTTETYAHLIPNQHQGIADIFEPKSVEKSVEIQVLEVGE